jgi:hypothetical protein
MAWPTTDDGLWYIFDGQVLMPVDPTTGAPILMLRPQGGVAQAIPAVANGLPGQHAEIDATVNLTALTHDDPTADGASWTTITPPDDDTPGVYRLNLTLHNGAPGDDGTTTLTTGSVSGTAAYKKIAQINSAADGFGYTSQKVGGRHFPVTINNTGSGNANSTLAVVSISAGTYDHDYRVEVEGQTIVTGTGANVLVDLVARLGNETSGNIIGRCFGLGGTKDRLVLSSGPPAGSADTWDKVSAGAGTTVYLRTEQQSGSDSYTTSSTTTRFCVTVRPIL